MRGLLHGVGPVSVSETRAASCIIIDDEPHHMGQCLASASGASAAAISRSSHRDGRLFSIQGGTNRIVFNSIAFPLRFIVHCAPRLLRKGRGRFPAAGTRPRDGIVQHSLMAGPHCIITLARNLRVT